MNQSQTNPFPYSDTNKRYYTYDCFLKHTFGGKCAKIPLDAGMTCPNIDGRCGHGGCIYCSSRGSGDFACESSMPLLEQYQKAREMLSGKWSTERCIPYFQAHTNTYAPLPVLRDMFDEVLTYGGVVGMNIATRADCLPPDVVGYLAELAEKTTLTVELGLQTVHDHTAKIINRGHSYEDFIRGYTALRQASPKILTCIHVIFGLPEESQEDMLDTVKEVAKLHPHMVKIHLLHVLKNTPLATMYEKGQYIPMDREAYIDTVVKAIPLLPPDVVVARLTGDGKAEDLLAPLWSRRKMSVINDIDKRLYEQHTWQGKSYST